MVDVRAKDGDSRVNILREATKKEPNSARAHARLGTALLQAGAGKEAEAELKKAVEIDPTCVEAWVNLGGVYLARWDFVSCVEANRKALEQKPDLAEAHYNMGLGYLYQGHAEEMIPCFERVIELKPDHAGGHYHLAVGLLAVDRVGEARASLGRARSFGWAPPPEFLKELDRKRNGGKAAAQKIEPKNTDSTQ